ncbi:MAG: glycolate oxidase iron-sulfur subunit [Pseudomonadales bacterium]|jgi:glycolate oxidase iron-sulfur subunit
MQPDFSQEFLATDDGKEAERILNACVHCGFCTATCPTYQLDANELDSPRGRIYLIKEMLEDKPVTDVTQTHLDRCLSCQSCETTCPSGVEYHKLLNIGRKRMDDLGLRPWPLRLLRSVIGALMPKRQLFSLLLGLGQFFRPVLPATLKALVPVKIAAGKLPTNSHSNKVVLMQGCVQPGMNPNINAASARVLDKLNVETILAKGEVCCGALNYHLDQQAKALALAKTNIDLWCQHLDQGVQALVINASGCGNFVNEYADLLKHETGYADKAARVVNHTQDIGQYLAGLNVKPLADAGGVKLAFHSPCTLRHGLKQHETVERLLKNWGFDLTAVQDPHLCCGSAGTYSLLQPERATRLRTKKLAALNAGQPELIATANIGCQSHLQSGSELPVQHWVEILDNLLAQ